MLCENIKVSASEAGLSAPRQLYVNIFLAAVVMFIMLADVYHPYLFSMDEPREAEIARETLVDGNWVTPHLCGLPFLEKPPLYYDMVAAAYYLTGSISPTVARSISMIFGIVMLAGVFFLCNRWAGARRAWLAVLVLIAMPRFFYYSHQILLDIAVGAFCTAALAAFGFWLWWADSDARKKSMLCLFYLASAGAFLSKGVVGVFHIVVVVGAFCLITRQWQTLRKLVFAWPIFIFIVPVVVWVYLFYREGGIGYLYEHFVNNVIGRFLKVQFVLPSIKFYNTDLGRIGRWYFYINFLPSMIGPALVILLPAIWEGIKLTAAGLRRREEKRDLQADIWLLLLIWAIVPVFLLSFSAAKESSYIIPSYAAMAMLVGAWLDERLPKAEGQRWKGIGWLAVAAVIGALSLFPLQLTTKQYLIITAGITALTLPGLLLLLFKKGFTKICFLLIAITICVLIIYNAPQIEYDIHKCHCGLPLAREVWTRVGTNPLYLYQPKDLVRGSIGFYGNRTTLELDLPEELRAVLESNQKVFVLMADDKLKLVKADTSLANLYTMQPLPDFDLGRQYILLTNIKK